jgi:hypothetical protein
MKKIILIIILAASTSILWAQAKTTNALQEKFESSLSLYFYKNSLRMLNQTENKDFDEMVKNIDKLKFLMVDKSTRGFGSKEYQKLLSDYRAENYESAMTGRMEGRSFDVYIKDKPRGTVVLVNDSTNLYVLDMIGTIDASKVGTLFSTIDKSTDIGEKIKNFTEHKGKNGKKYSVGEKEKSDH